MVKKIKRPPRSGHKDKRGSTPREENISAKTEIIEDNVVRKERKACPHFDKGIDLAIVTSKIFFAENIRCEDCRECVSEKRGNKGKGKQAKNKSESKAIWVCLECGHFACGGIGFPTIPQSHAVRHANQTRHHLAIQYENRRLRWCFPCSTLIPVEKIGESCKLNDPLSDIATLVKGKATEKVPVNVEDVWFGNGSILSEIKPDNTYFCLDGTSGYMVSGLSNLGNTCFFNSIMQNLLALDRLRDHYMELDESVGPLTGSLKQIIVETIFGSGLRNVDNLRSLFDCVCAKAPQFKGYRQHDSHELLRCLLDGLSTEELSANKRFHKSPFIDGVFGGQLSSTISCLDCGHSSRVFEPFLDLSLPVPIKKTPSKKVNQPISQARKQNLFPKRKRQYLPISNSSACFPVEFLEPVAREADKVVNNFMGQNMEPETKTPSSPNQIATEEIEKKPFLGNAIDSSTLLDYLDPDIVSKDNDTTSKYDDIVVFHDAGEKDHGQLYDSVQNGAESSSQVRNCTVTTTSSSENLSWLDYVEPSQVVDGHAMALEFDDCLINLDIGDEINQSLFSALSTCAESNCSSVYSFENGQPLQVQSSEIILLPHKEDCCSTSEIFTKEGEFYPSADDGSKSPGYFFEEEQPLQVQSSEVILLPYNCCSDSEILTKEGEVSSSADGWEPNFFVFDGFGDLFNEPEVVENVKPMSNINYFQADTSSVVGNTESDSDEVDNSNFQVSIESCLASFTKSELLSTPEHGWICENCSKALQEQKRRSKEKQKKAADKIGKNGVEDRVNHSVVQNTSNGVITRRINSLKVEDATGEKIDQIFESSNFQENTVGISHPSEDYVSDVSSNVCSANDSFKFEGQNNEVKISAQGSESETNGDAEMNFGSIKVKRDATKRIFINKAPSILTIHLKRFSQDARGRLSKLSGHVEFKDAIDLRPYMDPWCKYTEECKYRLSGVVEHSGTMRMGHYVAYIRGSKNSLDGDNSVWYHASDARVRQVSFQQVLQCEAYILFYEKI